MNRRDNDNTTDLWEKEEIQTRRAAEYLRERRIAEHLKLIDVAERSHGAITVGWLSYFERGGLARPTFMRMVALAEVYHLTLDQMVAIFKGHMPEEEADHSMTL